MLCKYELLFNIHIVMVINDVTGKSREQTLIIKEHIAMHTKFNYFV